MKINKNKAYQGQKILFLDIETTHALAAIFGIYDQNIPHKNILSEWKVASIAWKWKHTKKTVGIKCKFKQTKGLVAEIDDSEILKQFHAVLEEADTIVGHNIEQFDFKKLKARFIQLGLAPLGKKHVVDTLKIARQEFAFLSNRLDYIATYLGLEGKMSTPEGLWLDVLKGDKKALDIMLKYNIKDVDVLEKVYTIMLPWIRNHPNHNAWTREKVCPACGSSHIHSMGERIYADGLYQRYQCQSCRHWSREKIKVDTKTKLNSKLKSS